MTFEVLVVDDLDRSVDSELFRVRRLDEIGLDPREQRAMAAMYDTTELGTAVKPFLLHTLLSEGAEAVYYFDPDIAIYSSVALLLEAAPESGIVLTPHLTVPIPRDGCRPSEADILMSGAYNLGFIGVGRRAAAMLEWWGARLRRDAIRDPQNQLFTDQRWIDLVPGYFGARVVRDHAFNVAYWNLHERQLEYQGARYLVNGEPLAFFHFSGFDPRRPEVLSRHMGDRPRFRPSHSPGLARLCAEYANSLLDAGFGEHEDYAFGRLSGGMEIDLRMRRLYRDALLEFEKGEQPEPPNPFDPDDEGRFEAWLREPAAPGLRISRYLYTIYENRPDLRAHFPNLEGPDSRRFLDWVGRHGVKEATVLPEFTPSREDYDRAAGRTIASRPTAPRPAPSPGINVAGYFRAELGVGEAARQLIRGIEAAGVPFATSIYDRTLSRQAHPFTGPEGDGGTAYDVNVICVNADMLPVFAREQGTGFFRDRYTVGLWFWETEDLPPEMRGAYSFVDEVWAASRFVRDTLAKPGLRPVRVLPLPIHKPEPPAMTRSELDLPEGFLFYFSFDFLSVLERKNPVGLIEAFKRAFRQGEGPRLLIKSINGEHRPEDLDRVVSAAAGREDILVRDGYVGSEVKEALTAACDCYVSLHRSEGFGLTMAEAMALGKPVIATGYSGNLAFMTPENSYLVGYRLAPIGEGAAPYLPTSRWAYADLDEAAARMREVYEKPAVAARRGRRAAADIERTHSPEAAAEFIKARLAEIHLNRDQWRAGKNIVMMPGMIRDGQRVTPGTELPTRYGGVYGAAAKLARRVVFRALRPYDELQRRKLDRLESEVNELRAQMSRVNLSNARVERVVEHHYSKPFMSDPSVMRTTDAQGRPAIGYRNADANADKSYASFEDIFRGSDAMIRERQRAYLPVLTPNPPVLDAGCGRGEMLDLLAEAGVEAIGVDLDESMVERARARGHVVHRRSVVEYLEEQDRGTFGAIFSAQVVEHLPYEQLLRFFELARRTLKPGGALIVETVNPHSIRALKSFWVDLTHQHPIFPEVAVAFCRMYGFEEAVVMFPNGTGNLDQDLYEEGEYAVVARIPRPASKRRTPRPR